MPYVSYRTYAHKRLPRRLTDSPDSPWARPPPHPTHRGNAKTTLTTGSSLITRLYEISRSWAFVACLRRLCAGKDCDKDGPL
jgi:hypothetical protein